MIEDEYLKQQFLHIYDEVITNNCYNISKEEIENNIIIDIGANRGFFSILCARMNAYKIYSFEPNKEIYDLMVDNCKDIDNIIAYNLGVFNKKVKETKVLCEDICSNIFNKVLYNEKWVDYSEDFFIKLNSEKCCLIGLDEIINNVYENKDIVLKIDCEGSEYEILFDTSYENFQKIKTIYIEIHELIDQHFNSQMLFGLLKYVGFEKVFESSPMFDADNVFSCATYKFEKSNKEKL